MEQLLAQIDAYRKEIESCEISNPEQLEAFRIRYLGTKGLTKSLFGEMKSVPNERKKEFGQVLNEFKQFAESKYEQARLVASVAPAAEKDDTDLTLPGDPVAIGSRHPITLVRNRIVGIFQRLGFYIADVPEIEDDWHTFTALNLP